jgi:hypothetical protein
MRIKERYGPMSRHTEDTGEEKQPEARRPPKSCQLGSLNAVKVKNSWCNDLMQYRVNILRPGKRKAIFLRNSLAALFGLKGHTSGVPVPDECAIKAGDTVRVLEREEIRALLDTHEKYKGCLFIDEMYQYCGREFIVLKEVEFFFDEAKNRMCRCRNTFILEGITCSGRQRLYPVSCDRGCYFFWHRHWLRKV